MRVEKLTGLETLNGEGLDIHCSLQLAKLAQLVVSLVRCEESTRDDKSL